MYYYRLVSLLPEMHMLCRTRLHAASCSKRVYAVSAATHTHTPRYLRINLHGPSSNLGPIETVHSVDGRTRCIRRGKTQNGLLRMTPTRETRAIRRPAYAATWRCFSPRGNGFSRAMKVPRRARPRPHPASTNVLHPRRKKSSLGKAAPGRSCICLIGSGDEENDRVRAALIGLVANRRVPGRKRPGGHFDTRPNGRRALRMHRFSRPCSEGGTASYLYRTAGEIPGPSFSTAFYCFIWDGIGSDDSFRELTSLQLARRWNRCSFVVSLVR